MKMFIIKEQGGGGQTVAQLCQNMVFSRRFSKLDNLLNFLFYLSFIVYSIISWMDFPRVCLLPKIIFLCWTSIMWKHLKLRHKFCSKIFA